MTAAVGFVMILEFGARMQQDMVMGKDHIAGPKPDAVAQFLGQLRQHGERLFLQIGEFGHAVKTLR